MHLATGVIGRVWVPTELTLWGRGGVSAEVSRLHRRSCLPAGIVTRFPLAHSLKDMVQPQDMSHFVDHGVRVAMHTIISRVEDNTTWNFKHREIVVRKRQRAAALTHLCWLKFFSLCFQVTKEVPGGGQYWPCRVGRRLPCFRVGWLFSLPPSDHIAPQKVFSCFSYLFPLCLLVVVYFGSHLKLQMKSRAGAPN